MSRKRQLHRRFAFRRGKALRQQGLGVPAQAAAGFVCSGKGALGGGAGRLRGTVGFLRNFALWLESIVGAVKNIF